MTNKQTHLSLKAKPGGHLPRRASAQQAEPRRRWKRRRPQRSLPARPSI